MPTARRQRSPKIPPRGPRLPAAPAAPFFLAENLLEARRESRLPTNFAGPDEDVNIYLALRLAQLAPAAGEPRLAPGLDPLLSGPPSGIGRAACADWYRANADHRLLGLGLFHRGDGVRRRPVPWGLAACEARRRDLAVAAACYAMAASLLARGPGRGGAAAEVMAKLSAGCEDYAHVLGVLAVRRLGLGARLGEAELAGMLPTREVADAVAVDGLVAAVPADAADVVLDLWLEYARTGEPSLRERCRRLAPLAGLELPATASAAAADAATAASPARNAT